MNDLSVRLLSKRAVVGECWIFQGARDRCGYGRINIAGVNTPAHRASWFAFRGDPGIKHVLHNEGCTSRACFSPDHLHLGFHQQNMVERDDWGDGIRGERVSGAVLVEDDVRLARQLRGQGSVTWASLGAMFGVHESTIRHAVTGRSWRHV